MKYDITTVIAVYAAVLSTIGLGWNIYIYFRDRYDLHLSVHKEPVLDWGAHPPENGISAPAREYVIVFRMMNLGRQPATLVEGGFDVEQGETSRLRIMKDSKGAKAFPVKLQPGDWHELRFPADPSRVPSLSDTKFKLRGWVRDARNRIYLTGCEESYQSSES